MDACSTGINDILNNISYNLYPNPIDNISVIEFCNTGGYTFKVYNISGKLVKQKSEIIGDQIYIKHSEYKSGTYLFKLFDNKKNIATGKFIIK